MNTHEGREPHDVKFSVGTGTVVCTCGDYFETEWLGVTMPRNAVNLWAEHVRRSLMDAE